MEAAGYTLSMDISITVQYERGNIIDNLKLRECCYGYRSPLSTLREDCEENGTQERQHLQNQCNSSAVPKQTESKGINDTVNEESCAEKNDEGTCASLILNVCMDPMLASCLMTELRRSRHFESSFRSSLLIRIQTHAAVGNLKFRICKKKGQDVGSASKEERLQHVHLRLWLSRTSKLFRMEPDIRWSDRMLPQWIKRVQMEDAFSWLSTLGGAYSSLGENMYNCALEAGRVALRQLYLAECLDDALLKSRCLLYIALSFMQTGQLTKAKKLVRQQYKFATSKSACQDTRLVCMCQGIWHHLRHHYAKRKET